LIFRICVSLIPQTITEALKLIEKAEKEHADFIEVRLDKIKNRRLTDITAHSHTSLIATNGLPKSPNEYARSSNEQIIEDAAKSGFEYVNVDLGTPEIERIVDNLHDVGAKVVISFHDFDSTPNLRQLNSILDREIAVGADLCKLVTTAKLVEDNLTLLDFVSKVGRKTSLICFSMGRLGRPSRLLSPLFGAYFTIASIEKGRETAEGQLTIQQMRSVCKMLGRN
jgi:3-dehydroquinate dehydratase type I